MTNPTSNYNFQMPTTTDLVTDLPADFEVFGQAVDTRLKALQPGTTLGDLAYSSATANTNTRLPIGTSGQVLAVSGGGVPAWTTTADVTPLTTKGDLFTFTTVDARLGVGANNTVLTADSAEATGLKWATPTATTPPFVGCSLWKSPAQSLSNATDTIITFENEEFDTNTFHSTSSNTSRITIPTGYAGKYLISATIAFAGSAVGNRKIYFFKNGGTLALNAVFGNAGADATRQSTSVVAELAVADYVEVSCQQNSGGSLDVNAGQSSTRFSIVYLGA